MMQRVASTHGRLVPKPESTKTQNEEEMLEEPSTIQDQIENLRTKISLKERNNAVLEEEIEESRQGAGSILQELYYETREFRLQLMEAINAEKKAVHDALRTHQIFQLAMTDRSTHIAIPWLDDKVFDMIKNFNSFLDKLRIKRKQMQECELTVMMLEMWPLPGSLPWEMNILKIFHEIEIQIVNTRIRRETAFNLHSKYKEIKFLLREEKGKYMPTLQQYEEQLRAQKKELQSLNKMLTDANTFRDEAYKNLLETEKENSANRKSRRAQMSKMKKTVEKALIKNHPAQNREAEKDINSESNSKENQTTLVIEEKIDFEEFERILAEKKQELADYDERAKQVVATMRVKDLIQIPKRYNIVLALSKHLNDMKTTQVEIRDDLIKQRDQLSLVKSHFQYSGAKQTDEHLERLRKFKETKIALEKILNKQRADGQKRGMALVQIQLTLLAIVTAFDEGGHKFRPPRKVNPKLQIKTIKVKTLRAIKRVKEFEKKFQDKPEPDRDLTGSDGPVEVSNRLKRVGEEEVPDSEEDEDELQDSRVPGRLDIKVKNQKFRQQAILRRGLTK